MISVAEAMAREAGKVLLSHFRQAVDMSYKYDNSLVTAADLASDRVIAKAIREQFPKDHIYSEETSEGALKGLYPAGSRVWVVDPLDGTANFANGLPYYAVSIALAEVRGDGEIDVLEGVVYAPASDDLFAAKRGQGAYRNGVRMSPLAPVSPGRTFAQNFLVTGFYYTVGADLAHDIERFGHVAQECRTIRRMGAAALDMSLTADGVFDGFWERGLKPWDIAAATLLLQEVGGELRNYDTEGFSIFGDGVIAGRSATVDSIQKLL